MRLGREVRREQRIERGRKREVERKKGSREREEQNLGNKSGRKILVYFILLESQFFSGFRPYCSYDTI